MAVQLVQKTSTGDVTTKKASKLYAVFVSHSAAANVVIREGGSGGTIRLQVYCPASGTGQFISKKGILFSGGIHATLSAGNVCVEFEDLGSD